LQADLAAVDRSKTPWVLVFQHRPLLCSTQGEEGDHIPGGKFLTLLEPTLLANKVDLVVTGHEHVSFFSFLKFILNNCCYSNTFFFLPQTLIFFFILMSAL